jgi:hypothetical protein
VWACVGRGVKHPHHTCQCMVRNKCVSTVPSLTQTAVTHSTLAGCCTFHAGAAATPLQCHCRVLDFAAGDTSGFMGEWVGSGWEGGGALMTFGACAARFLLLVYELAALDGKAVFKAVLGCGNSMEGRRHQYPRSGHGPVPSSAVHQACAWYCGVGCGE